MTDFMTALQSILVQPTCAGDPRAKRVQLQSTCNLCRESHKTQVWLCFLIVSFLSISTCSASSLNTKHLQKCLTGLRQRIQKSDAELYTPPFSQKSHCFLSA
ncbi:interleukin-15 isoform X6 [Channa argus]|uniref:interleukin-15 isoform X6 n=1 Tax=Channa argus TaxID=215402 RepID=UPI003522F25D